MDLRIFTEPQQGASYDDLLRVARATEDLGFDAAWSDVASYAACVDRAQVSTNQALLVGQGTLRRNVAGADLIDQPLQLPGQFLPLLA